MSDGLAKAGKDVFAGTCGGISVTLVGHPFDTIKVRLQTQPSVNPLYGGFLDCAKKTVQWEGVPGLYKGVMSPLAGQMFFRATLFGSFGGSKRWLSTNADGTTRPLATLDFYKAGAMTGAIAAFTEGPIDFYKSQIQYQIIKSKTDPAYKPAYTTVSACVKATIKQSGLRGPFQLEDPVSGARARGLGATIARNVPANAAYLGSFEVMKRELAKANNCSVAELPLSTVAAAGGFGGLLYWIGVFPIDVIKSAMMTDSIVKGERQFPTMLSTAKQLWAEGGLGRFYRGFTPCILRSCPANAAMLVTVDYVGNQLNK
eukprot:jgi/Tetstr1/441912/TSEL_030120.t1